MLDYLMCSCSQKCNHTVCTITYYIYYYLAYITATNVEASDLVLSYLRNICTTILLIILYRLYAILPYVLLFAEM